MRTRATSNRTLANRPSDQKNDDGLVMVNDFQGESFDISQTIDLESKDLADVLAKKDLLPGKAVTKKTQPPYGLLRADISCGGYPHHPPVNICG